MYEEIALLYYAIRLCEICLYNLYTFSVVSLASYFSVET